jgi:hypothetical protein
MVLFAVGLRGGNAWHHTIHDWIVVLTVAVKFFQVPGYNVQQSEKYIYNRWKISLVYFYNVTRNYSTQEQPLNK